MVELWHVRHAQRADEVSGPEKANFKSSTAYREGRYYDTPLTRYGHVQASKAGRFLSSLTFNQPSVRESSGFDRVYCSPLLRAVQTAYCISLQLGGLPLQVITTEVILVVSEWPSGSFRPGHWGCMCIFVALTRDTFAGKLMP